MTTTLARRGVKRTCQSEPCGLPFYDLNKTVIECPNCGAAFVPPPVVAFKKPDLSKRSYFKSARPADAIVAPVATAQVQTDDEGEDDTEDTADTTIDNEIESEKTDVILEIDEDDVNADEMIEPGVIKDDSA